MASLTRTAAPASMTAEAFTALQLKRLTEKAFMAQVMTFAKLHGWRVWHDAATNHRTKCPHCGAWMRGPRNPAGFFDLELKRPPRFIKAECKTLKGPLTREQLTEYETLERCIGIEVYVWRPSDWETIMVTLQ